MSKEDIILELYNIEAIKFGKFTLKSGIISPYYFNLRSLCSYPILLKKIAQAYGKVLSGIKYDAIAGVPYAGIPIATAISLAIEKRMIFNRKEAKNYGIGKMIIGDFKPGETVVLIDDVISDGLSKFEAIAPLENEGLIIKDIVVIIDRGQGGPRLMQEKGYNCHSLVHINDVITALEKHGKINSLQAKEAKEFLTTHKTS